MKIKSIRIISMLLIIFVFCGSFGFTALANKSGDSNGDGVVNPKDSLLLKQFIACWDVEVKSGADVNSDGVINTKDSLILKKYLANYDVSDSMIDTDDIINLNFPNGWQKGVNLGNMYEEVTPVAAEESYLKAISERGFDFVRIPIRWSAHQTDGVIDESFFTMINTVIGYAQKYNLGAIINIHHFVDMSSNPVDNEEILYKMWEQISERYKDLPDSIVFEILNEPNDKLTTSLWNEIQSNCIEIIRKTNPTRKLIVTGTNWGGAGALLSLVLPKDDNLIASFHYYEPFTFTHQGASWVEGYDQYLGTKWNGTIAEVMAIDSTFKQVRAWSKATGIPVILGEFGAYNKADTESRVRWMKCVRETAEKYGFSWSYWEFRSGFGIYNSNTKTYYEDLTQALIPLIENTELGTGTTGNLIGVAQETETTIGPVSLDFGGDYKFECPSWTGYAAYDTGNSAMIIVSKYNQWARVYFPLDITDTGSGFSDNTIKFTFKNIENSITDIQINLERSDGTDEVSLIHLSSSILLGETSDSNVVFNSDGTVTVTMNISNKYSALKGKFPNGLSLKLFIESVPTNIDSFDGKGSLEVMSVVKY